MRGLVTEPLVASSSGRETAPKAPQARTPRSHCAADNVGRGGRAARGARDIATRQIGHGMLLFAPWLACRRSCRTWAARSSSAIARGRARSSAMPRGLRHGGGGALGVRLGRRLGRRCMLGRGRRFGGRCCALPDCGWRPVRLADAAAWWKLEARRLGVGSASNRCSTTWSRTRLSLLLAGILGSSDYGGLSRSPIGFRTADPPRPGARSARPPARVAPLRRRAHARAASGCRARRPDHRA